MKHVSLLKATDVIHCETEKDWEVITKLLDLHGFTMNNGERYVNTQYYNSMDSHCIRPFVGLVGSLGYYIASGYTIHKAKDFYITFENHFAGDSLFNEIL